jgi:hypothetical protein
MECKTSSEAASMKVILNPPGPDTPGYNKRLMQIAKFEQIRDSKNFEAEIYEDFLKFLAQYIKIEFGKNEEKIPTEKFLLEICSENQMTEIINAVAGQSKGPAKSRVRKGKKTIPLVGDGMNAEVSPTT